MTIFWMSILLLLAMNTTAFCQIQLVPFAGVNSTSHYYESGGNYPMAGLEIEGRLKPTKISRFHISLVTGASYLANGFYTNQLFAYDLGYYKYFKAQNTDLTTRYIQIPFELKFNYQPFPLIEDFTIFFGGGVTLNYLQKATLTEKTTEVKDFGLNTPITPPVTVTYEDSRDITSLGVKQSLFTRFEIGMKYNRIHLAFRLSTSLQDMYYSGLQNNWNIPETYSYYINSHNQSGKTTIKSSEFVVGYRIY